MGFGGQADEIFRWRLVAHISGNVVRRSVFSATFTSGSAPQRPHWGDRGQGASMCAW